MKRNLLLISNSTNAGEEYLSWPGSHIKSFLAQFNVTKVLFVPFAGVNLSAESLDASYDVYEERVQKVFGALGFQLESVHRFDDPLQAARDAEALVVGGGNTFHLVKTLHEIGLMEVIRERVLAGIPYIGWSAGANVACPSMKTTNDMPISEPPSFNCLNLIPFQINPHYLDANPTGHGGETREQRILEFLTVNRDMTVAGLREACLLKVEGEGIQFIGNRPLRIFRFGMEPKELNQENDFSFLLS